MPIGPGNKAFLSLIYFFLLVNALIFGLKYFRPEAAVNFRVLYIANLILFIVGSISVRMTLRALTDKNTQVFLRMIYGSFLLKFFVFAIAAFIYISMYKKDVNRPALFGSLGLYILYTVIEVRAALKQSKKKDA
jgi:hypothetical protein